MTDYKYIIIGSGPAGISAVEGIRKKDSMGKILVISRETPCYSRPLITYYFSGKINKSNIYYKDKDFFKKNKVTVLEDEVIGVNIAHKKITLRNNIVKFEKLLIATGGESIIPPVDGADLDGVEKFNSLKDVSHIIGGNYKNKTAVVLGAGMIGLKVVEALKINNYDVHLVELQDKILPNVLDKEASDILAEVLKDNGVKVYLQNPVVKIEGDKKVRSVVLKSGEIIKTCLVISAAGVVPNFNFIKIKSQGGGMSAPKGIKVNDKMETVFKDIYAAGDVTASRDIVSNDTKVIAIWPLAVRQGRVAGINMASGSAVYTGGWLMNSVSIFNYSLATIGESAALGGDIISKVDRDKKLYKKIIIESNRIKGVILMGDISRAGIYNGLIEMSADVSSFRDELLEEKFSIINVPRQYRTINIAPLEV